MTDLMDGIEFREDLTMPELPSGLWWAKGDRGSWDGPHADWVRHREVILTQVQDHSVVVQAGGNMGLYPKLLSPLFGTVYTFEPQAVCFQCLCMNATEDNIVRINAALSDENGLMTITNRTFTNLGMGQVHRDTNGSVPSFTVDQLCLSSCGLIWLDIEKHEDRALAGAMETIRTFKPVIATESMEAETLSTLKKIGYEKVGQSFSDSVYVIR